MPGTAGPNLGIVWGYIDHEDNWGQPGYNFSFAQLDAVVQLAVLDTLATPPGSPAAGDRYIVGAGATGAWAAHDDDIAVWQTIGITPAWVFYNAKEGWRAWHVADAVWQRYDGGWVVDSEVAALFTFTTPTDGDIIVFDSGTFVNVRPMRGIGFGSDPTALLTADQEVFYHRCSFPFTIVADFADYQGASTTMAGTALATADVILRVQRADAAAPLTFADVGTITIGAGTVDVVDLDSTALDIEYAKNDIIRILAPTSPDATFKGVFGNLVGYQAA